MAEEEEEEEEGKDMVPVRERLGINTQLLLSEKLSIPVLFHSVS